MWAELHPRRMVVILHNFVGRMPTHAVMGLVKNKEG